jgi:phosphatidylinositol alpha-1,6-mannosyltransferase
VNSLLLTPELFKSEGGIARILRLYLKALCEISGKEGHVRLIALNDREIDSGELNRYSNASLVEWEVSDRSRFGFCAAALRMGRRSDRIICGHVAQLPVAWAVAKFKPGLKYYAVAHGIEVWRPFSFLERLALRGASKVLCVSEFTRQQVLKFGGLRADQTAVLPNALDPDLSPSATTPAGKGPPIILSVSRLSLSESYKGIEHLVAAMPAVLAAVPGARLRVVGRGDGLPSLQALAHRLNLHDSVEFVGFRSDHELLDDFAGCRLFALPSRKEGFGLVYIEAMAHGRPCLGARSGGVPEVITGDTGVLVDYGDVPGIAASIVAALGREWPLEPFLERVRFFSYSSFRDRLSALLSG